VRITRLMIAVLAFVGIVRAVGATSIVYYDVGQVGTDEMQAALNGLGSGFTVTDAASAAAFQTDIASGSYNIGIFLLNSGSASDYSSAINALGTFAAGGGGAIFSDMSSSSTLDAQFGLSSYATSPNWTSMNLSGALDSFLSGTSIALTNPGYTTFATGARIATTGHILEGTIPGGGDPIIEASTGKVFWNGFADGAVAGTNGVQLYRNEILTAAGQPPSPVPLPATAWLMLSGLGGLYVFGRREGGGRRTAPCPLIVTRRAVLAHNFAAASLRRSRVQQAH
jgi:hypothetical protein